MLIWPEQKASLALNFWAFAFFFVYLRHQNKKEWAALCIRSWYEELAAVHTVMRWHTGAPVDSHAKGHVPRLHHTGVNLWADLLRSPRLFQPLPKPKLWLNLKASRWRPSAREVRALAPVIYDLAGLTLGSGFPVILLSSSWRCGQLPWEYQPGLSSEGSPSLSSTSFTVGKKNKIKVNNLTKPAQPPVSQHHTSAESECFQRYAEKISMYFKELQLLSLYFNVFTWFEGLRLIRKTHSRPTAITSGGENQKCEWEQSSSDSPLLHVPISLVQACYNTTWNAQALPKPHIYPPRMSEPCVQPCTTAGHSELTTLM